MSALRENIQRSLRVECTADIIGPWLRRPVPVPHQSSRIAFKRVIQIVALLTQRVPVNASTLARQFNISTKTIQRDLDFLRKELGAAIRYVRSDFTYVLDADFSFQLNPGGRS